MLFGKKLLLLLPLLSPPRQAPPLVGLDVKIEAEGVASKDTAKDVAHRKAEQAGRTMLLL